MSRARQTVLLFLFSLFATGQAPLFQWARSGTSVEAPQFSGGVVTDKFGSVFLLGLNAGRAGFPDQQLDSGYFVAKYRHDGSFLWSRQLPGTIKAIDTDDDGYLLVAGDFKDDISIGNISHQNNGGSDFFVAKLDGSGAPLWSRAFGGRGDDLIHDIDAGRDNFVNLAGEITGPVNAGGFTVADTGYFVGRIGPGGAVQWALSRPSYTFMQWGPYPARGYFLKAYEIETGDDGTIYVLGMDAADCQYCQNYRLTKYSPSGYQLFDTVRWDIFERPCNLEVDSKKNIYVTFNAGSHYMSALVLTKYDELMIPLWGKYLGNGYCNYSIAADLTLDRNDNPSVCGWLGGSVEWLHDTVPIDSAVYVTNGDMDAVVWQFDGVTGKTRWIRHAGGSSGDMAAGLSSDPAGNIVMAVTAQHAQRLNPRPPGDTCFFDNDILYISSQNEQAQVAKIRVSDHEFLYGVAGISSVEPQAPLILAPNPGNGLFRIINYPDNSRARLLVRDLSGRLITVHAVSGPEVDLSTLAEGIYLVEVVTERAVYRSSYVRQRDQ